MTAGLTQVTERFKFLVAFRPGIQSVTLMAQMAATYQRISQGRLLLNVVVGGDDVEQLRFGDDLGKEARYERAAQYLHVFRELWSGEPVDFAGEHVAVRGAQIIPHPVAPKIYLGGSSAAAIEVAAAHADVYLTWGEPPDQVAEKLARVCARGAQVGRTLSYGIRLHVIARDSSAEAWAEAQRLLDGLSAEQIAKAQAIQRASQSEGQQRMVALHGGRSDGLEVYPNLAQLADQPQQLLDALAGRVGPRPRRRARRTRPGEHRRVDVHCVRCQARGDRDVPSAASSRRRPQVVGRRERGHRA